MSCSICPVYPFIFWPSNSPDPVQVDLSCLSDSRCPAPAVLSCFFATVVLFQLSCPVVMFWPPCHVFLTMAVLPRLSSPDCPLKLAWPGCPVPAVLSRCPDPAVLSQHSCPAVLLSLLSCLYFHVLIVPSIRPVLDDLLPCPRWHVIAIMSFPSCPLCLSSLTCPG